MAKANDVRTWATLAAILVAILLAAPIVKGPANASRGDVSSIAFISDRGGNNKDGSFDNIYRMNADGHGPARRLTDTSGNNVMPTWSPDGSAIAFVNSGLTGIPSIYRMNADGSGETRITSDLMFNTDPAWFPGGRRLVFSRGEDIYVMTLGSTRSFTRLTRSASAERQPVISPSGEKIAFASNRDGDFDIYVMKLAPESSTNRPVKLTKNSSFDFAPDWAPGGGRIAFSRGDVGSREIYTMKAVPQNGDINRPTNLTKNIADDSDPAYFPDGKKIAFASDRSGDGEIWQIDADGEDPTNLTRSPSSDESQPDWQPLP